MEVITVIPTRGLIFAETLKSLQRNGVDKPIIISGLSIPEAQNVAIREAMKDYCSYIWFVEDDMWIPDGTLTKMLKMDKAVVAVDYPIDNGCSTICRKGDEIVWCGIGCTLIRRGVLSAMDDPWFDTSYSWKIVSENPLKLEKIDNPYKYGGLDINFFMKVREKGFSIDQLLGVEAKHLRCANLIKNQGNNGMWDIQSLSPISKQQQY